MPELPTLADFVSAKNFEGGYTHLRHYPVWIRMAIMNRIASFGLPLSPGYKLDLPVDDNTERAKLFREMQDVNDEWLQDCAAEYWDHYYDGAPLRTGKVSYEQVCAFLTEMLDVQDNRDACVRRFVDEMETAINALQARNGFVHSMRDIIELQDGIKPYTVAYYS